MRVGGCEVGCRGVVYGDVTGSGIAVFEEESIIVVVRV